MPRTTRRSTRTPIPEEDAEALPPPKTTKPKSTTSLPRSRSTRSIRSQEPSTITDDTEIKAKSTKKTKKSTASTSTDLDPPQPAKRQRRSAQIRSRSRASTPPDEEEVAVKVENEDNDQNQEGEQNAEEGEEEVEEVEKEQEEEEPEEGQDEVEREQDETERDQDQTDKEDEPEEAGENQSEEIADVARNEEHGQAAADLPHPVDTENEPSAVASKENSAEDYTDSRDKQNDSPATPATVMPTPVHPVTPPKTPPVRRRPLTPMKLALDDLNRAGEPRLVIDRIVLVNFKSYAGRQVIGPFHKSFSAIVGPNGSGKSNTIDALLFVFGFKATKMRQGKLSELIHNSSASPPGGFESCSVEVWFKTIIDLDGSDEFNVIPNSKLVVARIATRNNMSKYTIDGKLSNFAEVTTLLKAKGIDLDHKRFLILQGEVESIAQMKPKATTAHDEGLLEYLEDIIGTNRFKEPIEQTQQTLEEVASKRSQQLERVKLVEREKVALGARKKVADEYLARMNTLVQQQNLLWQFYIHTGQTNLEKLTGSMNAIDNKVKENEEAHAGDLQENEALRVELEQEEGAYKDVEVETDALVKELGRKERELVSLTEKMKHGKTKQKKLKKSITEDEHILKEAAATIRDGQEEIEILKVEVESKEKLIEKEEVELDQIRDSLKDKTQVFADQIEVKQAELAPWAAQVTSKKAALDLATSERDLLLKKATDFSSALASAQETVTKIDEETKAKKAELKQLKLEHAEYQEGIDGAAAELKKLDNEEAKLRTKLTTARQKADEAKTARTTSSSKNEVLKSLSKLHKQGRLSGFFGRLGDLGRIDDMYDVAISTACPQLDNLVCDTVDTGQQCLAHLKKTNAGRAVIICLDALKTNAPAAAPATPENAPRLVDLVTTQEPMFKAAFYHVLRDTLVAKDLTQANRIAFGNGSGKRWRVVTLDGKLIDSSGTMSGGGTRVARGLMSSKMTSNDTEISEEVVARLEQDTVSAEAEIAQHSGNRSEIQAELRRLQSEQPKLEMRITKLEMDIGGATKRKEEAKKTILELGSEDRAGSNDDAEVKHLESVMEKLEAELQELRRKTGKIEQSIKDLQEKILEVGGVRLRTQQSKVKDLKAMVEHANNRLTKAEVGRSKAERDTSKHEKTLKKSIAELEVLEGEISELEAKVHSNSSETEAMKDTVDQARMALEEQKERLQDIQERRKEKLKIMNVFQLSQTELKQQREKVEAALAQSAANVKHWNEKQASLKLNLIEDDEDDEEELERREAAQVLKQYSAVDFEDFDAELTKAEVAKLEEDQERASPDLGVLKEYAQREAEFMARAADLERTTRARDEAKQLLEDLNQQRLEEFMWGFQIISGKLKEMYQMITLGGNAELELVDSLDPFSEGIIFSVMPPKKSWKNISNLSGGEKTLSSLALVFALHAFKPTPLYFMDEIDAALDFRNVSIIGNYIKDRTKNAQFIIISLRNNMFELSRRLVGIYKTSNCTKSIAVDNTELNEVPN
ncbi:hypothetical protein Pst134EA_000021 [Puccinia striiformis f. sp. tritici]|uniref:Structural maintenance of chromosomes protein n=1 Tax=Puccinia striiformis f. sp. tritici PST-78 TaxID=1165861 RepID=A0A0L0UZG5_9BASI|nr:hypothetical protein Pst134EA_000021 [Puccinia striiformis f. sp. tritici]KAH9466146.1 hypothetical protein Pst134EB_001210 [Puccinia striiformis f. sp. tritici]KAH9472937.1 hypothetical protein Pst134EA_000021 [Puccinia striiformis f. sp. tritici]KNE92437.1 hypothetical protein PSTG_14158 [Puccinia striiformis f. sp. tritici PST-78]